MKKALCLLLVLAALFCCAAAETAVEPVIEPTAEAVPAEATAQASEETAPVEATAEPISTPEAKFITLGFEDGFTLELPEGWKYYKTTSEMAEQGVLYCLSNADGDCWLYIQRWLTDCADIDALKELIDRAASPLTSGVYTFSGTDFVIYDLKDGDISCCAALLDGCVLNFVFTPQSDAEFMATATRIISSFTVSADA